MCFGVFPNLKQYITSSSDTLCGSCMSLHRLSWCYSGRYSLCGYRVTTVCRPFFREFRLLLNCFDVVYEKSLLPKTAVKPKNIQTTTKQIMDCLVWMRKSVLLLHRHVSGCEVSPWNGETVSGTHIIPGRVKNMKYEVDMWEECTLFTTVAWTLRMLVAWVFRTQQGIGVRSFRFRDPYESQAHGILLVCNSLFNFLSLDSTDSLFTVMHYE